MDRRVGQYACIAVGLLLYFFFLFHLFVNEFEDNRMHPYQGALHDSNGMPIGAQ